MTEDDDFPAPFDANVPRVTSRKGKVAPLTQGTVPYKVLAWLRKVGPRNYKEISAYMEQGSGIKRNKYIDPALQNLRLRGFIDASVAKAAEAERGFRWKATAAGRLALRNALPSVDSKVQARRREREREEARHQAHVDLQIRAGIPEYQTKLDWMMGPSFRSTKD